MTIEVMPHFEPKTLTAVVVLAVLWTAETIIPFYDQFRQGPRARLAHAARNLGLGIFNAVVLGLMFGAAFAAVESRTEEAHFGLLRFVSWPAWVELVIAFALFDLWIYVWHRANHVIPFLWRFHRMHHSDPEMDATTAIRFHTGEAVLSRTLQLAVVPLLGIALWQLACYEAVFLPVILLHHSNVRLPRPLDHGLLAVIVTPAMHRVHHSRRRRETNSNYGSVFPYWDFLLRTFRLREDARTIHLGLDDFDAPEWQGLLGMLRTPLASVGRPTVEPGSES